MSPGVQSRGSISSNLLIGQHEKLPNITGSFDEQRLAFGYADGAFDGWEASSIIGSLWPNTNIENGRYIFNASHTTGTGAGVYEDNAHVQPNNISCRSWLRVS